MLSKKVIKLNIIKKISFFVIISLFFIQNSLSDNLIFDDKVRQIKITSKIIDIKKTSQTIDFIDNVVIESGNNSLTSDKMTVFFEEGNNKKSAIKKIDAISNVKIFANDFVATANKGYYNPTQDIFVLQEKVVVNNGMSIASGEHFLYDLKNEKGIFIGQKKEIWQDPKQLKQDDRVKIIINQDLKNLDEQSFKN